MPRGGTRPGAGRPKGRTNRQFIEDEKQEIASGILPPPLPDNPILPLDYMLRVLNDPDVDPERKDKMAQLAAPYCHPRSDAKPGKKETKTDAAKQAATGKFGARPAPSNVIPLRKEG